MVELKVPTVGESISEAVIGEWFIAEGDWIAEGEAVVEIETDKVNAEIPAPVSGRLVKINKQQGESATVDEVIGAMEAEERPADATADAGADAGADAAKVVTSEPSAGDSPRVMPAAQRVLSEKGIAAAAVTATGPGGRVLKEDALRGASPARAEAPAKRQPAPRIAAPIVASGERTETEVPMSPLRRRVAERLVQSQQTAALLTTFNEVDMSAVMELRKRYKQSFLDRHGVKLGFMSFFVKAVIAALDEVPALGAEIRDDNIVYRSYRDIGIAVGGGKGLVVPVIRNAEKLSFAAIEQAIMDYAVRARDGKLKLEELQGGTFTISNGGVYGSMLSTPIVNPPQSGILGMHNIDERAVVRDGQIVIRPMMYVALTYDHRLVDGREAVTFLIRVKESIEDPARLLLEA